MKNESTSPAPRATTAVIESRCCKDEMEQKKVHTQGKKIRQEQQQRKREEIFSLTRI